MPRIPLIEELTTESVPIGSVLLVEFDAASQWYNSSISIAATWLKEGGTCRYGVAARPPDKLRAQMGRLGVNAQEFETNGKLIIHDWYTCTLGQKSKEKYAMESLKVADLSIFFSEHMMGRPGGLFAELRDFLRVLDDLSSIARFNDEKTWVEFILTRYVPSATLTRSILLFGLIRGVHSDWVYNRLEAAVDGVIDFRLQEEGEGVGNSLRIRSMRDIGFDSRWHPLKIGEKFEVGLAK